MKMKKIYLLDYYTVNVVGECPGMKLLL